MTQDDEHGPEKNGKRPPVRVISPGLVNLGNTCFANSLSPYLGLVPDKRRYSPSPGGKRAVA